jgi:hypothetical protein
LAKVFIKFFGFSGKVCTDSAVSTNFGAAALRPGRVRYTFEGEFGGFGNLFRYAKA